MGGAIEKESHETQAPSCIKYEHSLGVTLFRLPVINLTKHRLGRHLWATNLELTPFSPQSPLSASDRHIDVVQIPAYTSIYEADDVHLNENSLRPTKLFPATRIDFSRTGHSPSAYAGATSYIPAPVFSKFSFKAGVDSLGKHAAIGTIEG
jgi:hypothetical protein